DYILVRWIKKNFRVKLKHILYIESIKDYILIHTAQEQLTCYQSISSIRDELPRHKFLRIHRSYVISLDHLKAFNYSYIFIGNQELPIGRTYREEVQKVLES
ncbi:MAG: LytTR family transcriptional regulator, partial [Bacteroidia bacterium]|nr:LytTR family transcriptional regulator [Bacteroidia bacterium]